MVAPKAKSIRNPSQLPVPVQKTSKKTVNEPEKPIEYTVNVTSIPPGVPSTSISSWLTVMVPNLAWTVQKSNDNVSGLSKGKPRVRLIWWGEEQVALEGSMGATFYPTVIASSSLVHHMTDFQASKFNASKSSQHPVKMHEFPVCCSHKQLSRYFQDMGPLVLSVYSLGKCIGKAHVNHMEQLIELASHSSKHSNSMDGLLLQVPVFSESRLKLADLIVYLSLTPENYKIASISRSLPQITSTSLSSSKNPSSSSLKSVRFEPSQQDAKSSDQGHSSDDTGEMSMISQTDITPPSPPSPSSKPSVRPVGEVDDPFRSPHASPLPEKEPEIKQEVPTTLGSSVEEPPIAAPETDILDQIEKRVETLNRAIQKSVNDYVYLEGDDHLEPLDTTFMVTPDYLGGQTAGFHTIEYDGLGNDYDMGDPDLLKAFSDDVLAVLDDDPSPMELKLAAEMAGHFESNSQSTMDDLEEMSDVSSTGDSSQFLQSMSGFIDDDDDLVIKTLNTSQSRSHEPGSKETSSSHLALAPNFLANAHSAVVKLFKVNFPISVLEKFNIATPTSSMTAAVTRTRKAVSSTRLSWTGIEVAVDYMIPNLQKMNSSSDVARGSAVTTGVAKFVQEVATSSSLSNERLLCTKFVNHRDIIPISALNWSVNEDRIVFKILVRVRPRYYGTGEKGKPVKKPKPVFIAEAHLGVKQVLEKYSNHVCKWSGSVPLFLLNETDSHKEYGGDLYLCFELMLDENVSQLRGYMKKATALPHENPVSVMKNKMEPSSPVKKLKSAAVEPLGEPPAVDIHPTTTEFTAPRPPPLYFYLHIGKTRSISIPSSDSPILLYLSLRFIPSQPIESPPILFQRSLNSTDCSDFDFTYRMPVAMTADNSNHIWKLYQTSPIVVEVWVVDTSTATPKSMQKMDDVTLKKLAAETKHKVMMGISDEWEMGPGVKLLGLFKLPAPYLFTAAHVPTSGALLPPSGSLPWMVPTAEYPIQDVFSGGHAKGWITAEMALGTWDQLEFKHRQVAPMIQAMPVQSVSPTLPTLNPSTRPESTQPAPPRDDVANNDKDKFEKSVQISMIQPNDSELALSDETLAECELMVRIHRACGLKPLVWNAFEMHPTPSLEQALEQGPHTFIKIRLFPGLNGADSSSEEDSVCQTELVESSFIPQYEFGEILTLSDVDSALLKWIRNGGESVGEVWHVDDHEQVLLGTFQIPLMDLIHRPNGMDQRWYSVKGDASSVTAAVQVSMKFTSGFDFGVDTTLLDEGSILAGVLSPKAINSKRPYRCIQMTVEIDQLEHVKMLQGNVFCTWTLGSDLDSKEYATEKRRVYHSKTVYLSSLESVQLDLTNQVCHAFRDHLFELVLWLENEYNERECIGKAYVDVWPIVQQVRQDWRKQRHSVSKTSGQYMLVDPHTDTIHGSFITASISVSPLKKSSSPIRKRLLRTPSPERIYTTRAHVIARSPHKSPRMNIRRISMSVGVESALFAESIPVSTYVTFQWDDTATLTCRTDASPTHVYQRLFEVALPESQIPLLKSGKHLEFKVWRNGEANSLPVLLGTASVDLAPLFAGLDMIHGWYHIWQDRNREIGQLLVKISPKEPFQVVPLQEFPVQRDNAFTSHFKIQLPLPRSSPQRHRSPSPTLYSDDQKELLRSSWRMSIRALSQLNEKLTKTLQPSHAHPSESNQKREEKAPLVNIQVIEEIEQLMASSPQRDLLEEIAELNRQFEMLGKNSFQGDLQEEELAQEELLEQALVQDELYELQEELHQQELMQEDLHQQSLLQEELHQQALLQEELHQQALMQEDLQDRETLADEETPLSRLNTLMMEDILDTMKMVDSMISPNILASPSITQDDDIELPAMIPSPSHAAPLSPSEVGPFENKAEETTDALSKSFDSISVIELYRSRSQSIQLHESSHIQPTVVAEEEPLWVKSQESLASVETDLIDLVQPLDIISGYNKSLSSAASEASHVHQDVSYTEPDANKIPIVDEEPSVESCNDHVKESSTSPEVSVLADLPSIATLSKSESSRVQVSLKDGTRMGTTSLSKPPSRSISPSFKTSPQSILKSADLRNTLGSMTRDEIERISHIFKN